MPLMLFTARDWPWKLIVPVLALLGGLLYGLYWAGPRFDVAALLLLGTFLPILGRDAAALAGILARGVYAGVIALLLWWGGFW